MEYLHPLVWFIACIYLGIISIETTMIVYDNISLKKKIIYGAYVKTKDGMLRHIEVITNKLTKRV